MDPSPQENIVTDLHHTPAEQMRVNVPDQNQDEQMTSTEAVASKDKSTQPTLLEHNEMLCFLQNRLKQVPADTLIKLSVEFYSGDEITSAKKLLFAKLQTERRMISRQGPEKATHDVHDIVRILLEQQPGTGPVFAASNLSNLPPLGLNNADVLKLLKEIESMKANINALCSSQSEIVQSQTMVMSLLNSKTQPPVAESHLDEVTNSAEEQSDEEQDDSAYDERSDGAQGDDESEKSDSGSKDTMGALAAPQTKGRPTQSTRVYYSTVVRNGSPAVQPKQTARTKSNHKPAGANPTSHKFPKRGDGANDVVIGRGRISALKASNHKNGSKTKTSQMKQCIGVFVTRLKPWVTAQQVQQSLLSSTGIKVHPNRLETKYDTYASFLIRCNNNVRNTLLNADIWDSGTLLKPYYQ